MTRGPKFLALAGTALLAAGAPAALAQSAPAKHARQCFELSHWRGGWRSPAKDVIYLGTDINEVWRLDLVGGAIALGRSDVHLVNISQGGDDTVCEPIDLRLYVADYHGFRTPLTVKAITRLTPEEAAALPAKFRP